MEERAGVGWGTLNTSGPCEGPRNVGKGDLGSSLNKDKSSLIPVFISFIIYSLPPQDVLKNSPHILDVNT